MRPVLICLVFSIPATATAWQGQTYRSEIGDHDWSDTTSWDLEAIPTELDAVFVPGFVGESRLAVPEGVAAKPGALIIGSERNTFGRVEISQGTLSLQRTRIDDIPDAGRIIIGESGGRGELRQIGGVVLAAKVIRIGDGRDSSGRYVVSGGTMHAGSSIQLATSVGSTGVFEIYGSSGAIATRTYSHGSGDSTLKFFADAFGVTPVTAHSKITLNGTLDVNLTQYNDALAEIRLIDNRGSDAVQGGFSQFRLRGAEGYELDYSGGDGNDVVLKKITEDVTTITSWASHYLPDLTLSRQHLQSDSDNDAVSNLAEYRLGTLPDFSENWDLTPKKTEGRWRVRYSEVLSRADAAVYPQVQVNGRWRSDRLRVEVVSEADGVRVMEASFRGQARAFRLAAELTPDKSQPMNVMLFLIDDLNDWVGCLNGHPQASTPNMDSLADRGVLFTNAHCNGVNCNASRTSFLTGVYPSTSGIYLNQSNPFRISPVLASVRTLPEHFKLNGYQTAKSGKVFHREKTTELWDDAAPLRSESGDVTNPDPPKTTIAGGQFDWSPIDLPDEAYFDHQVATWMIDKLNRLEETEPYFMTTGFYRPHIPWYAPPRFFDKFPLDDIQTPPRNEDDLLDLPRNVAEKIVNLDDDAAVVGTGQWKAAVQGYLAATSFADEQVGRVLNAIDQTLSRRNTVIALISDHGFHLGEKKHWRKQSLWGDGTRVPMMIVAPGTTRPGSQVTQAVSLIDLYPTLADLAGTEPPGHLEGISLASVLADTGSAKNLRALTTRKYRQHSLRDNRYTYIRYSAGREEFYDRSVDPHEWNNLAEVPEFFLLVRKYRRKLPKLNTPTVLPPRD